MREEDKEKKFQSIMDKLFHSPTPKQPHTSSPNNQSSRGKKRPNSLISGSMSNSIVPFRSSSSSSETPICRPWDRADLLSRLATFKSMTWFAKPQVVSAVNCARRGWINVEMDIIACEACGARLLFSTPSSWTQQQIEKAAAVFSLKLDSGHKLLCPWINNACDEALAQFPPTSVAALVDGYRQRYSALLQLFALPVVSSSVVDYMRSPELDCFLEQSSTWEFGIGSVDATRIQCLGRQTASGNLYYQALKLVSLCGWEPRSLPYVVDCKDLLTQSTGKGHSKESSTQIVNGQSPGVTMYRVSGADEEINEYPLSLSGQQSDPASVVLDCRLCGASVGLWAFSTIPRPLELFRIVETPEGNCQNSANCDSSIINCIAGSSRNDDICKEGPGGHMGTTILKDRPSNMNFSIGGGPLPAEQNYRASVSLPIISRHLRVGLSSNLSGRGNVTSNVSSICEEMTRCDSRSTDLITQEKELTIAGELIHQSENIGLSISGDNNQSRLSHELNDHDVLIVEKNGDTPSEKDHTSLDAFSDFIVENPSESLREVPHENGGIAGNAEMGVENTSQVNELNATLSDFNGTIVNGETSHTLGACSDLTLEDPPESLQEIPHENGRNVEDEEVGVENATLLDSNDTMSNGVTSPGSCATRDVSCEMALEKDNTGTNCQKPLCGAGRMEKGESVKKAAQRSVNVEVVRANGLVKDLKQLQPNQAMEFDPIRQHRHFCPWIVSAGKTVLGWQQTLSALNCDRGSSRPSLSENTSLSMLEVDDPIVSVRNLFMSPSTKRTKTTYNSR